MAHSTANVVSASMARWNMDERFAGVRCTRPSAASAEGATVAALAVHIADALEQRRRKRSSSRPARAITSSSEPVKPRRRSVERLGLGWGGSSAWAAPSSCTNRIFSSPCSAAARGLEAFPPCAIDATFPRDSPP